MFTTAMATVLLETGSTWQFGIQSPCGLTGKGHGGVLPMIHECLHLNLLLGDIDDELAIVLGLLSSLEHEMESCALSVGVQRHDNGVVCIHTSEDRLKYQVHVMHKLAADVDQIDRLIGE